MRAASGGSIVVQVSHRICHGQSAGAKGAVNLFRRNTIGEGVSPENAVDCTEVKGNTIVRLPDPLVGSCERDEVSWWVRCRRQLHLQAQGLPSADGVALQPSGLELVERVRSHVMVGYVVAQHGGDADQQTVCDRQHGPRLAASPRDAVRERLPRHAGGAGNRGRELAQDGLALRMAFGRRSTQLLACAPFVAGTDPRPGRHMGRTGKPGQVRADCREDGR